MATPAQVKAFIEKIAPIAQKKVAGRDKWSLPSVCIAQACCESAYGTSPKMIRANAVFGIKVGKSRAHFGKAWKDKAYSTKTKECYDGKTYTNIIDMFRAYDSIENAVEDYYDMLLTCSRYRGCLNQTDPKKCITEIQKAPYATDPDYIKTIMSIVNTYTLTQYDSVVTGKSGTAAQEKDNETIRDEGIHVVKKGDTLTKIAKKYGTTVNAIVAANRAKYPKMTANYIVAGWKLKV